MDSNSIREKLVRTKTLLWISLLTLIVFLLIPSIIEIGPPGWLDDSEWDLLVDNVQLIALAIITSISATLLVTERFRKITHNQFKSDVIEDVKSVQEEAIEAAHGEMVEPKVLEALTSSVFDQDIVRKDSHITLTFESDEDGFRESITWRDKIHNLTNEEYAYKHKILTSEEDHRVVMTRLVSSTSEGVYQEESTLTQQELLSRHEAEFSIPVDGHLNLTKYFDLNYGIKDDFYHNTIGFRETTIGLTLEVEKPKGYSFEAIIYGDNEFDKPQEENIVEETSLVYHCRDAFLPGTAVEYFLKKN